MRTQTNPTIRGAFASKLNAVVTPMRRERIETVPAFVRANPHLDPETHLPRHIQKHMEDLADAEDYPGKRSELGRDSGRSNDTGRGKGAHLKDPVFHVRSWLLRRDCMNAYNLLTDDEIRSTLKRHGDYVRGTVRTLAATWDNVVI